MNGQERRTSGAEQFSGCMVCGRPLIYRDHGEKQTCTLCGREQVTNIICPAGHFVCDRCHEAGDVRAAAVLRESGEKDPLALLEQVFALPGIHLHGPEHHVLVPCVLLTAFRNNGGGVDLADALTEALQRGRKVPGGTCGYWGVCGAAAGTGIFANILLGGTPLRRETWGIPQKLTADCLYRLAEVGGPRCCKRTCRICVEEGVRFVREQFGVDMPVKADHCRYAGLNRECIGADCPYFC